ncbi:MAG: helicase C-terminal domain-containing protein, partial [Pseudomonadales bacterium]|nr:helicase C-terminal domain-containing protein [Pseudomonadales bacterium]
PLAQTRALLGLPEDTTLLRLPCPFPPERRRVLLVPGLDLRHAGREHALPALTELVAGLVQARPGHHLVFAPSFAFAARLGEALAERLPEAEVPVQTPAMDEGARAAFLDALARPDGRTRVACAVAGGLFGEAIDLPGDCLVGVVVAGLPLPAPDVERRAVQDYHGADGFDVAFRFPAMTRVLQAAGRLIRAERDAGVVCLVDRRFAQPAWRALLPREWTPERCAPTDAPRIAETFWARVTDPSSSPAPAAPADALGA